MPFGVLSLISLPLPYTDSKVIFSKAYSAQQEPEAQQGKPKSATGEKH